jgi:hypothetical protein
MQNQNGNLEFIYKEKQQLQNVLFPTIHAIQ